MILKIKTVYIVYTAIILIALLSAVISYVLLQNIVASRSGSEKSAFRQRTEGSPQIMAPSPYPTRSFGIPLPGADTATVNAFWESIKRRAVAADSVDMTDCKANPQIASMTLNGSVTLTNSGEIPVTLRVSDKVTLTIPAQATITNIVDFGHGYGVYDLYCNGSEEPVGIFVVENA